MALEHMTFCVLGGTYETGWRSQTGRFAGLSKRLMGLEPTTFCMASSTTSVVPSWFFVCKWPLFAGRKTTRHCLGFVAFRRGSVNQSSSARSHAWVEAGPQRPPQGAHPGPGTATTVHGSSAARAVDGAHCLEGADEGRRSEIPAATASQTARGPSKRRVPGALVRRGRETWSRPRR